MVPLWLRLQKFIAVNLADISSKRSQLLLQIFEIRNESSFWLYLKHDLTNQITVMMITNKSDNCGLDIKSRVLCVLDQVKNTVE